MDESKISRGVGREKERERLTDYMVHTKRKEKLPPDGKWVNSRLQLLEAKAFTIIPDIVFLPKNGVKASFDWL